MFKSLTFVSKSFFSSWRWFTSFFFVIFETIKNLIFFKENCLSNLDVSLIEHIFENNFKLFFGPPISVYLWCANNYSITLLFFLWENLTKQLPNNVVHVRNFLYIRTTIFTFADFSKLDRDSSTIDTCNQIWKKMRGDISWFELYHNRNRNH